MSNRPSHCWEHSRLVSRAVPPGDNGFAKRGHALAVTARGSAGNRRGPGAWSLIPAEHPHGVSGRWQVYEDLYLLAAARCLIRHAAIWQTVINTTSIRVSKTWVRRRFPSCWLKTCPSETTLFFSILFGQPEGQMSHKYFITC